MTERTTENVSEWMTIENLRTYLEELRDEHGEEHEFATRISSDCVVVKFIEDSLPGYKVGECNYGSGTASVKAAGKAIVIAEQYWEGAAEISEMAVLLKRGIGNVEGHFYHKRADNLIEVRSAHSSAILRGDS